MVFNFLITIVFIAEIIIAVSLAVSLIKFDKKLIAYNEFLEEAKPSIKSLMILIRKISGQILEFAPLIVKQVKTSLVNAFMGQIKSLAGGITFWLVKKEVEKHV